MLTCLGFSHCSGPHRPSSLFPATGYQKGSMHYACGLDLNARVNAVSTVAGFQNYGKLTEYA